MNLPLRIIEKLKANLADNIAETTDSLATAPVDTMEKYQFRVGLIHGLRTALDTLDRVIEETSEPKREGH